MENSNNMQVQRGVVISEIYDINSNFCDVIHQIQCVRISEGILYSVNRFINIDRTYVITESI